MAVTYGLVSGSGAWKLKKTERLDTKIIQVYENVCMGVSTMSKEIHITC